MSDITYMPPERLVNLRKYDVDPGIDCTVAERLGIADIGKITPAEVIAALYNHALRHNLHSLQNSIMSYADKGVGHEELKPFLADLGPATRRLHKGQITVQEAQNIIDRNGRVPYIIGDVGLYVGFEIDSPDTIYVGAYDESHGGTGTAEKVIRQIQQHKSSEMPSLVAAAIDRFNASRHNKTTAWQDYVKTSAPLQKGGLPPHS